MKMLLSAFIVLCMITASAQVPGYKGRHMALHVETAISPALNGDYLSDDADHLSTANTVGINTRLIIAADYTVSKSVSLGFSGQYLPTMIPYAYYAVELPENPSEIEYAGYLGDVDIDAYFGSAFIKLYSFGRSGAIAPVGKYHKIEIAYGYAKASTGGYVEVNEPHDSPHGRPDIALDAFEDLNYEYAEGILAVMYSYGKETVYFDRLIGNINMQIGAVLWEYLGNLKGNFGTTEYEFQSDLIGRIGGAYFLNLTLGIGYFVF